MSFRIFAVGHPHFHFERANNADDDLFEAANVANALRASAPSVTGAGSGVATYATPNSLLDATNAFATMQFLGLLKQSVELLALRTSARHGWISVAPRESHILWPDTTGFAKYMFDPGVDPGTEFFNKIKGPLEETNLNSYGTLRMLANVLTRYENHISEGDPVMIQIQLFH